MKAIEEMTHGGRTRLDIVPVPLGDMAERLASCVCICFQKSHQERYGRLCDWAVLHQKENKAINRRVCLVVVRLMIVVGPYIGEMMDTVCAGGGEQGQKPQDRAERNEVVAVPMEPAEAQGSMESYWQDIGPFALSHPFIRTETERHCGV